MDKDIQSNFVNELSYEDWIKSFDGLSFEESSLKMKEHLIKSCGLEGKSKDILNDSYDYMMRLVNQNKEFEPKLYHSYLKDVKGYNVSFDDIIRLLMLLSLCGFGLNKFIQEK